MTLQFRTFHRVEIGVEGELDVKIGGPVRKAIVKTFYIANHSASESIAIALASISETVDWFDPWDKRRQVTMRVLSKDLYSCAPEKELPRDTPITFPDEDSGITVHNIVSQPLPEGRISSLMQGVLRRGHLKMV